MERIKVKDWIVLWILIGLLITLTVFAVRIVIMNYDMFFTVITILLGVMTMSFIVISAKPSFKKPIFCVLITASLLVTSFGLTGILMSTAVADSLIEKLIVIGSICIGALLAFSGRVIILNIYSDEV